MRLKANVAYLSYVAFTSNATYVAIRLWGVVERISTKQFTQIMGKTGVINVITLGDPALYAKKKRR